LHTTITAPGSVIFKRVKIPPPSADGVVERQGNHREVTPEESEVTKDSLSLVMRKEADSELAGVSERSYH
jgi:hypothetical protein